MNNYALNCNLKIIIIKRIKTINYFRKTKEYFLCQMKILFNEYLNWNSIKIRKQKQMT